MFKKLQLLYEDMMPVKKPLFFASFGQHILLNTHTHLQIYIRTKSQTHLKYQ